MKRRIHLFMIILFCSASVNAQEAKPLQVGDFFPEIKGQFLNRENVELLKAIEGKVSLLIIAFKRGTQQQIDTWTTTLFPKADQIPHFRVIEIPMISNFYSWMSSWIDKGMRSGIPEHLHKNILTYYGPLDDYYSYFDVQDKETCYLFLLDEKGTVQYKTIGPATKEKLSTINREISFLLNELQ